MPPVLPKQKPEPRVPYNRLRCRRFFERIKLMQVGDASVFYYYQAPTEAGIRRQAQRLGIHLRKIYIPAANKIVIARVE